MRSIIVIFSLLNMENVGLNAINTIAAKIKITNEKIWANQAFTKYTMRNVDLLKSENEELEKQTKELEAELARTETYIKQIRSTTDLVKMSLETTCESIRLMDYMKILEAERTKYLTLHYSNELADCRKRFTEHKARLDSTKPLYKELKDLKIKKKLLEIEVLDLKQKVEDQINMRKQYRQIQKKIWQRDIIRFAKACLDHYKARDAFRQLKIAEAEEKELIKQVFYLQKKANEKKMLNFRSSIVKSTMPVIDFSTLFSAEDENHISKEKWASKEKLQESTDQQVKKPEKKVTEISLPVLDLKNAEKQQMEMQSEATVPQTVTFTPTRSKVHVLEVIKVQAPLQNTLSQDGGAHQTGMPPNLAKSTLLIHTSDVEHTPENPITNPTTIKPQIPNEVEKQPVSSPFFQTNLLAPFLNFGKNNVSAVEEMKEKKSAYPEPSPFGFGSKKDAEKVLFSGIQSSEAALAAHSSLNLTGELDVSHAEEMQWSPTLELHRPDETEIVDPFSFQDPNKNSAPESNNFTFGSSSFFNMF